MGEAVLPEQADCVIIGAGPAGLAVAARLGRLGVRPLVLERGHQPAWKWRNMPDGLQLNTSALMSGLPGRRLPWRSGRWPTRDQMVRYYDDYCRRNAIWVQADTEVGEVRSEAAGWSVVTNRGIVGAAAVVVACGREGEPVRPQWPGLDAFSGSVVHSSDYRRPSAYRGHSVLVVGSGNSGFQIAVELEAGGAGPVHLTMRNPPQVIPQSVAGIPYEILSLPLRRLPPGMVDALAGAVSRISMRSSAWAPPRPSDSALARLAEGRVPTIDPGTFRRRVREGRILVVAPPVRFEERRVWLEDDSVLEVDDVVLATGYRSNISELLASLPGALDERSRPRCDPQLESLDYRGLFFVGYIPFGTKGGPMLRHIHRESGLVAPRVAERVRTTSSR